MDKCRLESRRKDYKKNFVDPRRRREDAAVQIRKTQRENQVTQKRSQLSGGTPAPFLDIQEAVKYAISESLEQQMIATQQFRRLLAVEKDPPIQAVIDTGIVPRLIQFLKDQSRPQLQLEAAWTLTNIASGTMQQTKTVTDHGAIPIFVDLLSSPKEDVRDQAVWALGNIAGDCAECRDMVLNAGVLQPLLIQIRDNKKFNMLRNATWALSNLCRGSREPDFVLISPALPTLRQLIYSTDVEVLADACWALQYLLDTSQNERKDEIINAGVCGRLVELLNHPNTLVQNPALRSIGQIIAGTHQQTEIVIQSGVLASLLNLLSSPKVTIKKEATWVISNVAAGTTGQIQGLINYQIIPKLVSLLDTAELEVKRECAWALSNAVIGGTTAQIEHIVGCDCLKPLCNLLMVKEQSIVQVALEAIDNILRVGKETKTAQNLSENPFVILVEEADGFSKLERLQAGSSQEVYQTVIRIIKDYFPVEEDFEDEQRNVDSLPQPNVDAFGVAVPQAGFNFGAPAAAPQLQHQVPSGFAFSAQNVQSFDTTMRGGAA